MNGAAVFLVAFFTSVATAVGTVYVIERLDVFDGGGSAGTSVVPDLGGLTQQDAMTNLNSVGLVLQIGAREPSPDAADGTIIRQSLPPGQSVPRGQTVTVTLARALPKVPTVVGKNLAEATAALVEAGFKVKEGAPVPHDTAPLGQIVLQSPEAGHALKEQELVTVQASSGPGVVEVPKVTGYNFTSAQKLLEESGLKATVRWVNLAETSSNIVLRQTPNAGESAKAGSEIELVINRD